MKSNLIVIGLLCIIIIAGYLGLFAQDIAYYLSENISDKTPFQLLMSVTILSIGLFIAVFGVKMLLVARQQLKPRTFVLMLITNVFIGFFVSLWSLFVLVMWWE